MRARMALSHANISVELREILLSDRPDELYAISPKGTVPVLELPDGRVIDESFDIMEWALSQTQTDWMEIDLDKQLAMIKVNDEAFKPWQFLNFFSLPQWQGSFRPIFIVGPPYEYEPIAHTYGPIVHFFQIYLVLTFLQFFRVHPPQVTIQV